MTRHTRTLGAGYFEDMFKGDADPWKLETSPYEAAKFDRSIRALGGRSYANGLEVGCAGGSLTARLAPRTTRLLAVDISPTAVERARLRCAEWPNVRVEEMAFPEAAPQTGGFDIVVLSEVAYYWADEDLDLAACEIRRLLASGGDLLLVHWTGETDYPQSGDEAVRKLSIALKDEVEVVLSERHDRYRLDLWRRR